MPAARGGPVSSRGEKKRHLLRREAQEQPQRLGQRCPGRTRILAVEGVVSLSRNDGYQAPSPGLEPTGRAAFRLRRRRSALLLASAAALCPSPPISFGRPRPLFPSRYHCTACVRETLSWLVALALASGRTLVLPPVIFDFDFQVLGDAFFEALRPEPLALPTDLASSVFFLLLLLGLARCHAVFDAAVRTHIHGRGLA